MKVVGVAMLMAGLFSLTALAMGNTVTGQNKCCSCMA